MHTAPEGPIVRLQVENIKAGIIHHMGIGGSEFSDFIGKQVDVQWAAIPWDSIVRDIIEEQVRQVLTNMFRYGEGRTVLEQAIAESLLRKTTLPDN